MRLLGAGHDEKAGGIAVETVHDSGSARNLTAGDPAGEKSLHERSRRMAGRRMYDEAGRLVDDEQVLVFAHDSELELFRVKLGWFERGCVDLQRLAAGQAIAFRLGLPIDAYRPQAEEALCRRPRRNLLQTRQELVETGAGRVFRNVNRCRPSPGGAALGR